MYVIEQKPVPLCGLLFDIRRMQIAEQLVHLCVKCIDV